MASLQKNRRFLFAINEMFYDLIVTISAIDFLFEQTFQTVIILSATNTRSQSRMAKHQSIIHKID